MRDHSRPFVIFTTSSISPASVSALWDILMTSCEVENSNSAYVLRCILTILLFTSDAFSVVGVTGLIAVTVALSYTPDRGQKARLAVFKLKYDYFGADLALAAVGRPTVTGKLFSDVFCNQH